MTALFILFACISATATYLTFKPVKKHAPLAIISFALGMPNGELAHWQLFLQLVITLIFAAFGAINGLGGLIACVLLAFSWLGLLIYFQRALSSGAVVHTALQEALGNDYETRCNLPLSGALNQRPVLKNWLRPLSHKHPDVRVSRDIIIDQQGGFELKVDVYHHHNKPTPCPVLYQIHGGAWTQNLGNKSQQALPLMNHFAAQGWVCVTIDYRLSPKHPWPAHIIDCKKGLHWIKENIADFGGNADFIVATGGSAGGHLSSLLALTANDPQYQPGFEECNTEVQACIPFYGVFDTTNRYQNQPGITLPRYLEDVVMQTSASAQPALFDAASPIARIHDNSPPFLIIHGDNDTLANINEAEKFYQLLSVTSPAQTALLKFELAQHAFELMHSPHSTWSNIAAARFANYLYLQHDKR